jgi:hypothetical protein
MNINEFLIENGLRRLDVPEESVQHFKLVSALSNVDGRGFPKELFQLSAPVVMRGLLNFAVLQMNRKWVYPYWVHRQLDRASSSFLPRSQNPLLMNQTHRNWTALGSPHGLYEAIVDPRGLLTPLPREWSTDVWLQEGTDFLFPSLTQESHQRLEADSPCLLTTLVWKDLSLELEAFVSSIRRGIDIVFNQVRIVNSSARSRSVIAYVAVRPFNPEGVAPITHIEIQSKRFVYVNKILGVVVAKEPAFVACQNAREGDLAMKLQESGGRKEIEGAGRTIVKCERGLAQALLGYPIEIPPSSKADIHYSIALGSAKELRNARWKKTWRVSYGKRRAEHRATWHKELDRGAHFQHADEEAMRFFRSSRLALLELNDGEFISPGPALYHHFWFRDAAPMLSALDMLGFSERTRRVINGFRKHLRSDGFFQGPDGEWDSNGAALWTIYHHFLRTRSSLWLKQWYPQIRKAGLWIVRMRRKTPEDPMTVPGLMPKSLSAEHLGTVDQYFWDSFWSLAGLKCVAAMAHEVGQVEEERLFNQESVEFESRLKEVLAQVEKRLGMPLIPASPTRPFDESAIGSIASLYPLDLFEHTYPQPVTTLHALRDRYVDDRGFYHPIIHSGYNAYLTLQIAQSYLLIGEKEIAWQIARSAFRLASETCAFPEATHPLTGGGTMGDGHHGWAAAEVVLFVRNALIREQQNVLHLLHGVTKDHVKVGIPLEALRAPTTFGSLSLRLERESATKLVFSFEGRFFPRKRPEAIHLHIPFPLQSVVPSFPSHLLRHEQLGDASLLILSSEVSTLFLHL